VIGGEAGIAEGRLDNQNKWQVNLVGTAEAGRQNRNATNCVTEQWQQNHKATEEPRRHMQRCLQTGKRGCRT